MVMMVSMARMVRMVSILSCEFSCAEIKAQPWSVSGRCNIG